MALQAATFMPKVGEVAERHPRLKLIVDHLGRPSGTKDDAAWASDEILQGARRSSSKRSNPKAAFNHPFACGRGWDSRAGSVRTAGRAGSRA